MVGKGNRVSPRITVIIPVYNVKSYLSTCLGSLVDQTFGDWECICVDDGSTDGGGALLDEYAAQDNRFAIIHQSNQGVEFARQMALDRARGEYIAWLDADDYMDSRALLRYIEVMDDIGCDMVWFDFTEEDGARSVRKEQKCEVEPQILMSEIMTGRIWGALWNKVFRRNFLVRNNVRFSGSRCETMEDVYFLCRLLNANPGICYVPETYYHYVAREGSLIRRNMDDMFVRRWRSAAECILPLVRGRVADDILRHWILKLKIGIYSMPEISDAVFYSFFPECKVLSGKGWKIHHRILFWLACHTAKRQVIIRLLTAIRKVRHVF